MQSDENRQAHHSDRSDQASHAQEPEAASPWQYKQEDTAASYQPQSTASPVNWTASEFIDHEKAPSWFMGLAGLAVLGAALAFLVTHDIVTVVAILIAAGLFGVTAGRKPRTLQYKIDQAGINVAEKFYAYNLFKSFSILDEGAFSSIQLMPLKRFMPPISLYYPPEHADQIVTILANFLPHEEREHDPVDRLMRRIRF